MDCLRDSQERSMRTHYDCSVLGTIILSEGIWWTVDGFRSFSVRTDVYCGKLFLLVQVRDDWLDLRVPVWITDIGYMSRASASIVVTATGYHQVSTISCILTSFYYWQ